MVQLKEYVSALPGKLDFVLSENGENFSVGQRQMVRLSIISWSQSADFC